MSWQGNYELGLFADCIFADCIFAECIFIGENLDSKTGAPLRSKFVNVMHVFGCIRTGYSAAPRVVAYTMLTTSLIRVEIHCRP